MSTLVSRGRSDDVVLVSDSYQPECNHGIWHADSRTVKAAIGLLATRSGYQMLKSTRSMCHQPESMEYECTDATQASYFNVRSFADFP